MKVPCVILCGGRSRRFGRDKLRAHLAGKPLLTHVIDRVSAQCAPVALNQAPVDLAIQYGLENLPDKTGDGLHPGQGPLAGVLSALEWAQALGAPSVMTCAGDTPFIPLGWAAKLQGETKGQIVVPQSRGHAHYITALWPVRLYKEIEAALRVQDNRVGKFVNSHPHKFVEFTDAQGIDPFLNINTAEDMETAEIYVQGLTPR
ncbi:MAG TPA: molybdenum cofactor guanylyltransferase [Hellea balneolensis]|uniref:Molybdenum cofactor guanylyltransferase n=1 Tax=Hellea balneolensis TaxID=287478 RepID=A0A7C5LZQ8_9PROT|nr:molybdenum cofactor guanylyltransferase [Hellea balneolensis]